VFINESQDRYSRDHLAEYRGGKLEVRREFMGRRKDLVAFCAEVGATWKDYFAAGSDYFPVIRHTDSTKEA
jgi:hypothetical protein